MEDDVQEEGISFTPARFSITTSQLVESGVVTVAHTHEEFWSLSAPTAFRSERSLLSRPLDHRIIS